MTKIIKQQKLYQIGGSFYVLIPKDIRESTGINADSMYNLSFDQKSKLMKIKFLKGE